jgi:DNA-binding MarR family transcriptional regulator
MRASPPPFQKLGRSIKRLQHRHHRTLDERLAEHGTTLAQWDAMRAIAQHPGSSSHALAELTFQTDQAFGALANRMVDKALIERVAGAGRALRHQLTAKGEAVLEKAQGVANEVLTASFSPLTRAEQATLLALLEKVLGD